METQQTIDARAQRVKSALETAFGVKAATLTKALRKTGRRLPKRLHAEANRIVNAQGLGGHPKLMQRVDGAVLDTAESKLAIYLKGIDRAEARKDRWLSIAGAVAFNILLVVGCYIVWMVWADKI